MINRWPIQHFTKTAPWCHRIKQKVAYFAEFRGSSPEIHDMRQWDDGYILSIDFQKTVRKIVFVLELFQTVSLLDLNLRNERLLALPKKAAHPQANPAIQYTWTHCVHKSNQWLMAGQSLCRKALMIRSETWFVHCLHSSNRIAQDLYEHREKCLTSKRRNICIPRAVWIILLGSTCGTCNKKRDL